MQVHTYTQSRLMVVSHVAKESRINMHNHKKRDYREDIYTQQWNL